MSAGKLGFVHVFPKVPFEHFELLSCLMKFNLVHFKTGLLRDAHLAGDSRETGTNKAGARFLAKQIKSLSLMDENRRAHMYAGAGYSSGGATSFTVNL